MTDTPATIVVKNGAGADTTMLAINNGSTQFAFQSTPRVAGAPVDTSNPMPASDLSLGAPADAAWSGSGSGAVIGILKAIWTVLTTAVRLRPFYYNELNTAGAISVGGVAQQAIGANATRGGLIIQNQSTGDLRTRGDGTAGPTNNSRWIPAGSEVDFGALVSAVSIYGASTGQQYLVTEKIAA